MGYGISVRSWLAAEVGKFRVPPMASRVVGPSRKEKVCVFGSDDCRGRKIGLPPGRCRGGVSVGFVREDRSYMYIQRRYVAVKRLVWLVISVVRPRRRKEKSVGGDRNACFVRGVWDSMRQFTVYPVARDVE